MNNQGHHWAHGKMEDPVILYDPTKIDGDALALTLGPIMPKMISIPAYAPQQSIEVLTPMRYARSRRFVSHAPRGRLGRIPPAAKRTVSVPRGTTLPANTFYAEDDYEG